MPPYKSKTLATWLALIGGGLGLHQFYVKGWKSWAGWAHPLPTWLGWLGIQRILQNGQDDPLAPLLIPLGGLSLSIAMLTGIVWGLCADDLWDARRHQTGHPQTRSAGWATVIGVVLCLLIGAGVLMSTITYGVQRYFETQVEEARKISQ
jgi:hypothetical protein